MTATAWPTGLISDFYTIPLSSLLPTLQLLRSLNSVSKTTMSTRHVGLSLYLSVPIIQMPDIISLVRIQLAIQSTVVTA